MNPKLKLALSSLLALILLSGLCFAAGKAFSDDEIFDRVRRDLAGDPLVRGGALTVEVKDGVVTLKGTVDEQKAKARAEKLTKKVRGVKSVVNQLVTKK